MAGLGFEMVTCPNCGQKLVSGAAVCQFCGATLGKPGRVPQLGNGSTGGFQIEFKPLFTSLAAGWVIAAILMIVLQVRMAGIAARSKTLSSAGDSGLATAIDVGLAFLFLGIAVCLAMRFPWSRVPVLVFSILGCLLTTLVVAANILLGQGGFGFDLGFLLQHSFSLIVFATTVYACVGDRKYDW